MDESEKITVPALLNFEIGTLGQHPERPDILVLTLHAHEDVRHYGLDRRIAEALIKGLQQIAAKLPAPPREN